MSKKAKFSLEDEEKIIDFVKSNEILFNVKNKKFRDSEAKNRLWLELANSLGNDVELVKKKWGTMRDYYLRPKKTTGAPASSSQMSKREEALSFLHQSSILKRPTLTNIAADLPPVDAKTEEVEENFDDNVSTGDTVSTVGSIVESFQFSPCSVSQAGSGASAKKRKAGQMDMNDFLREFLDSHPKPSDFLSQTSADDVQLFCDSIAATIRKFSLVEIAEVKLKIAQIVGAKEIAWAKAQAQAATQTVQCTPDEKRTTLPKSLSDSVPCCTPQKNDNRNRLWSRNWF